MAFKERCFTLQYTNVLYQSVGKGCGESREIYMVNNETPYQGEAMPNKLTQTAKSTKNFVSKHRVAIAVIATTVVCYKAHTNVIASTNQFLADHGLLEEFYALREE